MQNIFEFKQKLNEKDSIFVIFFFSSPISNFFIFAGRLPRRVSQSLDHYGVLGVSRIAPKNAIKKAYIELAKKYHPDKSSAPEAAEQFRKVQAAYSILSNEQRRKEYDLSLPKQKDVRRNNSRL